MKITLGDFADSAKLSSCSRVVFYTILEPFSDIRPGLESEAGNVEDILNDGVCTLRREDLENNTAL